MNNQIELNDEQLDLVIGGSTFNSLLGLQTNVSGIVQVPVAVAVGTNVNVFGNNNTQNGAASLAAALGATGQSNS